MKVITLRLVILFALVSGCSLNSKTDIYVEPSPTKVASPTSIDDAIAYINSNDFSKQILGMWAIINYPEGLEKSASSIIDNLYDPVQDVRINAARVLGTFGPSANMAVPDLLEIMKNDDAEAVRIEAAISLGNIGNKVAVPFLAENLYGHSTDLAVYSAKSISRITNVSFPDAQSSGYSSNADGLPYILLAARDWWEKEGKYQDWSTP